MSEKQNPTIKHELLCKDIDHLKKDIEELRHTVYGNGHKGIKADLIELRTKVHAFRKMAVWQIGIGVAILCAILGKFL